MTNIGSNNGEIYILYIMHSAVKSEIVHFTKTRHHILFFNMKNCCILEAQWQSVTNSKTVIVTTEVSNKHSGGYFVARS